MNVQSIEVSVTAEEDERSATIERAWVGETRPLRPGETTTLHVLLRTRRGGAVTLEIPVEVPASTPAGAHDLLVADAATFDAIERQERRQAFVARDLPQLLEALNRQRAGNRVYARLTRSASGAIVGGEYLPALPQSVLSVLRSPDHVVAHTTGGVQRCSEGVPCVFANRHSLEKRSFFDVVAQENQFRSLPQPLVLGLQCSDAFTVALVPLPEIGFGYVRVGNHHSPPHLGHVCPGG